MIHLIIIDLRITQASTLHEYDITLAYLIPGSVGIWVSTRRRRRLNGEGGRVLPGADPGISVGGAPWIGEGSPAGPGQRPVGGPGGRSPLGSSWEFRKSI